MAKAKKKEKVVLLSRDHVDARLQAAGQQLMNRLNQRLAEKARIDAAILKLEDELAGYKIACQVAGATEEYDANNPDTNK